MFVDGFARARLRGVASGESKTRLGVGGGGLVLVKTGRKVCRKLEGGGQERGSTRGNPRGTAKREGERVSGGKEEKRRTRWRRRVKGGEMAGPT